MHNKVKTHTIDTKISVTQILMLRDNYSYLVYDKESNSTIIIDPSTTEPIIEILDKYNMQPSYILCTHHHYDHIGGIKGIREKFPKTKIISSIAAQDLMATKVDAPLKDKDTIEISPNISITSILTPGHTKGSTCFFINNKEKPFVFSGDTLFSFGCGRIFEGTYEQMYNSLQKLKKLPPETLVFCGHEYSLGNLEFAISIKDDNDPDYKDLIQFYEQIKQQQSKDKFIVPTNIKNELLYNPFLCTQSLDEFRLMRQAKDEYSN